MISVKDRDVMQKREAFLQTIQAHKETSNAHQNAVFNSTAQRFASPKAGTEGRISKTTQPRDNFKPADSVMSASDGRSTGLQARSNFGLTFQKGASGQVHQAASL